MKQILMTAALLIAAAAAEAQQGPALPRGKWWSRPEVVRRLQLAPAQQERLDSIFDAASNDLIDSKASVRKLEVVLQAELQRGQLRRAEIQRIANQLGSARAQLFERELMMLVDMRGVLEPQQWEQLQTAPRLQPFRGKTGGRRR